MQSDSIDPIVKRAIADGVLQRAARELDKLLEELAVALDPFPFFMGTSSIQALEIDPAGVAEIPPAAVSWFFPMGDCESLCCV